MDVRISPGAEAARPHADARQRSLAWALSPLVPGELDTALLTALLHRGERARRAWRTFRSRVPDVPSVFRTDTGDRRRLAPLLLVAVRENAIEAEPALLTALRTAYLREELRVRAYRDIVRPALVALRDGGLPFLVLKGAALSETVYAHPVLRHAHDCELLVADADVGKASGILTRAGLAWTRRLRDDQGEELRHASGLPFLLLRNPYRLSYYSADFETIHARGETARVAGVDVRVPSGADHLVHALGHASYSSARSSLVWAVDAWMLIAARAVDWDAFVAGVKQSRVELPTCTLLSYLSAGLQAEVPPSVLADVGRLAARADAARRDVALFGARAGTGGPLSRGSRGEWRQRLDVLRWRLFPSTEYLRWAHPSARPGLLPLLYVMRPGRYVLGRCAGMLRSTLRHSSIDRPV